MQLSPQQREALKFYDERYIPIFNQPLLAKRPVRLADHGALSPRTCRFCGLATPEVKFRSVAHAVPEFLGNKALISMNECDACNSFLAEQYEDHLSKWFGPGRTASQIKGKGGVPTYKADNVRMEVAESGLQISVVADSLDDVIKTDGPFELKLPVATPTQPYIPLHAAKALIKIACSCCPLSELHECRPAIDWLMGRMKATMSSLPILFSFKPGPNPYRVGMVMLLRRKKAEDLPFLWCIVATSNYRFQFFVPFCPSDNWMLKTKTVQITCPHFPVPFDENFQHGPTGFGLLDWAGTEPIVRQQDVIFHVERAEQVDLKKPSNTPETK